MVARQLWLRISIIAAALIFDVVLSFADLAQDERSAPAKHIKLNKSAFEHARQLIAEHRFVNDKHGAWRVHRPSAETDSAFVRQHGFDEYARWHLGIDESHDVNTKARYRFPVGDYKNLHRCALIAVQSRARQYRYAEIEKAATDLLKLMEAPSSTDANWRDELVSSH